MKEKTIMEAKQIQIKETTESDLNDILEVEKLAFGYDKEAELVHQLLNDKSAAPMVSLLAFNEKEAVGHILFTKAVIEGADPSPLVHILAPLAVIPGYQKQGVGGKLIRAGLEKLKELGSKMVFVLGHMDYYPRFHFIPDAASLGFPTIYPIPAKHANAWMVQALSPDGLCQNTGRIICAEALQRPEHWRE